MKTPFFLETYAMILWLNQMDSIDLYEEMGPVEIQLSFQEKIIGQDAWEGR
jgi:hypothetical protein